MPEKQDRLREAADALDALAGGASQPHEQEQPAAQEAVEPAAPPEAAAEEPRAQTEPAVEEPSPAPAAEPAGAAPEPAESSEYAVEPEPVVAVVKKSGQAKPRKPAAPRRPVLESSQISLRRTFIPILLVTGLAMALLGIWALGVLLFGADIRGGEVTVATRHLAKIMLLAWPVALILWGGAGFLMYEVYTWYRAKEAA